MPAFYPMPALQKAFAVISCISKYDDGLTFSEILEKLDLPKSTVYKILSTLEHELVLEKRKDRYQLGSMLIHYGLHALSGRDLKTVARPFLEELAEESGETAHLTIPVGMQSMILDVVHTTHPIRFSSPPGELFPLYCTSHGKTVLAFGHEFSLDDYLEQNELASRTAGTFIDPQELRKELEQIRSQGYSMDEIEYAEDIRCCAAPVFDSTGKYAAALGITATTITFGKERIETLSAMIRKTAEAISREMGYTG